MAMKENSYTCTITIAGRERTLRVSLDALKRFGETSGVDIIGNPGGLGSVDTLAKLIHALAIEDAPDLTLQDVRASMSMGTVEAVALALANCNERSRVQTARQFRCN